jgi:hypothetical protein
MSKAKAGTLFMVDSGSYSDYSVIGFFVVLKEFNPIAELREYLAARPEQLETYRFKESEYLAAILAKGLLLEIEYSTLHLGDYSRHTEVAFTPLEGESSDFTSDLKHT